MQEVRWRRKSIPEKYVLQARSVGTRRTEYLEREAQGLPNENFQSSAKSDWLLGVARILCGGFPTQRFPMKLPAYGVS